MKNTKLISRLLHLVIVFSFFSAVSCKNEGSNEQGMEAASKANGTNSGTDPQAEDVGAGQAPKETGSTKPVDTSTTTNNGNSTAKGSGMQ